MPTGNELIDAVAGELNRDDLLSTGADIAVSQRALNDSLRDILNRYAFSWRVAEPETVATVVNQTVYTVASTHDIFAVVFDDGTSSTTTLREISLQRYLDEWGNVDYLGSSSPEVYTRLDQYKIKVAPRPSSAAWNFRIYKTPEFADITTFTNSVTQVTPRAIEVVKLGMLARLYRHLHEFERATGLYSLYESQIEKMIKEDKETPNLTFPYNRDSGVKGNYWANPMIMGVE